jgi:hypothetical protein
MFGKLVLLYKIISATAVDYFKPTPDTFKIKNVYFVDVSDESIEHIDFIEEFTTWLALRYVDMNIDTIEVPLNKYLIIEYTYKGGNQLYCTYFKHGDIVTFPPPIKDECKGVGDLIFDAYILTEENIDITDDFIKFLGHFSDGLKIQDRVKRLDMAVLMAMLRKQNIHKKGEYELHVTTAESDDEVIISFPVTV